MGFSSPKFRSFLCCSKNGPPWGRLRNISGTSLEASWRELWVHRRTRQCCCCGGEDKGRMCYAGARPARNQDRVIKFVKWLGWWLNQFIYFSPLASFSLDSLSYSQGPAPTRVPRILLDPETHRQVEPRRWRLAGPWWLGREFQWQRWSTWISGPVTLIHVLLDWWLECEVPVLLYSSLFQSLE